MSNKSELPLGIGEGENLAQAINEIEAALDRAEKAYFRNGNPVPVNGLKHLPLRRVVEAAKLFAGRTS
jgi:hypothetical protein